MADRAKFKSQKTIRGIVFPRTGGMNTSLHAVTDAKTTSNPFFS